jgi:alpha-tubulin suppressor-like RCC1 family protein
MLIKRNLLCSCKFNYFSNNNIKVKQIKTGQNITIVLDEIGKLYSWGAGAYGAKKMMDKQKMGGSVKKKK